MTMEEIKKYDVPFYYWNCLTLQMENRDFFIVIKNEKAMEDFLKILIHSLDTVDGIKGSAIPLRKYILDNSIGIPKMTKRNI